MSRIGVWLDKIKHNLLLRNKRKTTFDQYAQEKNYIYTLSQVLITGKKVVCKNVIYPVHLHARQSLEFNSTWLQYTLLPVHWGNGAHLHTLSLTSDHASVIFL